MPEGDMIYVATAIFVAAVVLLMLYQGWVARNVAAESLGIDRASLPLPWVYCFEAEALGDHYRQRLRFRLIQLKASGEPALHEYLRLQHALDWYQIRMPDDPALYETSGPDAA